MKISKSMVEQYKFCPHKFKLVYLDKIKQETTPAMAMGTRFHEFAEMFFDHWQEKPPERWHEFIPEEFAENEKDMALYFLRNEEKRLNGLRSIGKEQQFVPVCRELRLVNDELELKGHIDRVDIWDKDAKEVTVVEYKTGWKSDLTSLKRELSFYKMLWDSLYSDIGIVTKFLIINPKRKETKYLNATKTSTRAIERAIAALRKSITTGDFPRVCSERKHAVCKMCSPDECKHIWEEKDESKM